MIKRLIIAVILLALVFGGIFGWKLYQSRQQAAMMAQPQPPASVAATEVRAETWRPRLTSVGTVEAIHGIFVTNEVAGKVSEILFDSGEEVSADQALLQLDDSVDQAELRGLIAERDLAAIEYRRLSELLRENSVSRSDVDQAKATLDNASAQVASKRALIAKKRITAPFAGRLGIRRVDLGEFLSPGSQVVPLQALDPVYVDFSLPERDFSRLEVGQTVEVRVTAHPDRVFEGRITAVNPGVEQSTRTVRVRASLANPDLLMRPGMFAQVGVLLPARSRVLTLPRTAITYNPYGDSVFRILEEDGELSVQRRQIRTGDVEDGRVEILDGLEAGDRVVLAGQVKLRNGQKVQIDNEILPEEGKGLQRAEDVTGRSGS